MILGIGTDLVDIERMRAILDRRGEAFARRVFTLGERTRCAARHDPLPCLANRFAAKEALAKALGLGIARMGLRNAEVVNAAGGAPGFRLAGRLARWAARQPGLRLHLSLSDTTAQALAMVVVEAESGGVLPGDSEVFGCD